MKITIYELLGLIKDGKAPKKIAYDGYIFELTKNTDIIKDIFVDEDGDALFDDYNWCLNDEVEIPSEKDEFIDIEEFNISYNLDYIDYRNIDVLKNHLNKDFQTIFDTLDVLIKNQKKIISLIKKGE